MTIAVRRGALVAGMLAIGLAGAMTTPTPAYAWERSLTITFYNSGGYGDGKGRITSDDEAIDCSYDAGVTSGDCSQLYVIADFIDAIDITLTLTSATGSYSCLSTSNLCKPTGVVQTFPVHFDRGTPGNVTFNPSFNLRTFEVHIDVDGPGSVSGNGGFCPVGGNIDYCGAFKYGAQANLSATPTAGYPFNGWDSGACVNQGSACTFTVSGPYDTIAFFGRYHLTIHASDGGTLCVMAPDLACVGGDLGSAIRFNLMKGTSVTAEADPNYGWSFDHWSSGPCLGKPASCSFNLVAETDLTATFKKLATPKPSSKPTATPAVTAAPASPGLTAGPGASPSSGISTPLATTGAGPSTPPPASGGPGSTSSTSSSQPGGAGSGDPSAPPVVDSGGTSGSPDLSLLLVVVLALAIGGIGIGFAMGRRATRPRA